MQENIPQTKIDTTELIFSLKEAYSIEEYMLYKTILQKNLVKENINKNDYIRTLFTFNNTDKEMIIKKTELHRFFSFLKIKYFENSMIILSKIQDYYDPKEILKNINTKQGMRGYLKVHLKINEFPLTNYILEEIQSVPNNEFDKLFQLKLKNDNPIYSQISTKKNVQNINDNSCTQIVLQVDNNNFKKSTITYINQNRNSNINNNRNLNNNQNNNINNNYNNNMNNNINNKINTNNNMNNFYNVNNNTNNNSINNINKVVNNNYNNNSNMNLNNNFINNTNNNNYNNQNNNLNFNYSNMNNNFNNIYNNNQTNNNLNNNNNLAPNNNGYNNYNNNNYQNNQINNNMNNLNQNSFSSNNYTLQQNNYNQMNNDSQSQFNNKNNILNNNNSNQFFNNGNNSNFNNMNLNFNMNQFNMNNTTPNATSPMLNNINMIQPFQLNMNNNIFNTFNNNMNFNANSNMNNSNSTNNQNNINKNNPNPTDFTLKISDNNNIECLFPLVGLKNVGFTCYMNATLQCLLHIPELNNYFFNIFPKQQNTLKKINKNAETKGQLSYKYSQLIFQVMSQTDSQQTKLGKAKKISPSDFRNAIGTLNPQFRDFDANDSKDLLLFLFQAMHEELNYYGDQKLKHVPICDQKNQNEALEFFMKVNNELNLSIFSYLFYGIFKSETHCGVCHNKFYNFQYFQIISFPLYSYSKLKQFNIYQGFKDFCKPEKMVGDNQCFCLTCQKLTDSEVSSKIYYTPPYLIINLDYGKNKKYIPEAITYGESLDLTGFTEECCTQKSYRLIAISAHIGQSGKMGHYIAFCKNPFKDDQNAKWYEFNDSSVSEVTLEVIKKYYPYILIFKRADTTCELQNKNK